MTFDPKKPVQTRDGRKARILATDIDSIWPIVAVIKNQSRSPSERIGVYNTLGKVYDSGTHKDDLVNIPERVSRWINLYPSVNYPRNRKESDDEANDRRICVIEVIYEDDKVIDVIKHDLEPK